LIVNQVKGIFQCKEPLLQKYKKLVNNLLSSLKKYDLEAAPQSTNQFANAMVSIGSLIPINPNQRIISIKVIQITQSTIESNKVENGVLDIVMEDKNLWHTQLFKFLKHIVLPKDLIISSKKIFKIKAFHFCIIGYILYCRGFDGMLLRCLKWSNS